MVKWYGVCVCVCVTAQKTHGSPYGQWKYAHDINKRVEICFLEMEVRISLVHFKTINISVIDRWKKREKKTKQIENYRNNKILQ